MLTREDILDLLCEPFDSLSAEILTEAEKQSVSDADVALALKQCKQMARVTEDVLGAPKTSDAEFIVALRNRISGKEEVRSRPAFGTVRLVSVAASVCVMLMVVVMTSHRFTPQSATPVTDQIAENLATALDESPVVSSDSLADAQVNPDSLAAYLGVADLASDYQADADSDASPDESMTEALLSLDPQSLAEVLNKIETTNFF